MDTAPTVGDDDVAQGRSELPEQPGRPGLEQPDRLDELGQPEHLVRFLAEAAMRAPSVRDTQPWWFGFRGSRIRLHSDARRRLDVADPEGREMLLSCGAALCTLRLAARYLGYEPEVSELPEPDQPDLLAELTIGRQVAVTDEDRSLYRQIWRRRGHRGAFCPVTAVEPMLSGLEESARREGAQLHFVTERRARNALAFLHEAAEHVLRLDPAYETELTRWPPTAARGRREWADRTAGSWGRLGGVAGAPSLIPLVPITGSAGVAASLGAGAPVDGAAVDGVAVDGVAVDGVAVDGVAVPDGAADAGAGAIAVLTTCGDSRADWLRAGQALQRVSLQACAYGLATAFHAEALEVPELRELIRNRLCGGGYPQLVLRLGVAASAQAPRAEVEISEETSQTPLGAADHVVFPEPNTAP